MKHILRIILSLSLVCCNSNNSQKEDKNLYIKNDTLVSNTQSQKLNSIIKRKDSSVKKINNKNDLKNIYGVNLIGMEFLNRKDEKNIYKNYAVDFTSACYSSDLCVFTITKDDVQIRNYYDKEISVSLTINEIKFSGNKILIDCENSKVSTLTLTKIKENISLYKIDLKGEVNRDIKISNYVAAEASISKFGGIDCGDFDG